MTYITKIFVAIGAIAILVGGVPAFAKSDVTDFKWYDDQDPTLRKTNMAPGDTVENPIGVVNDATDPLDVYINLDRASSSSFDDDFSKQLKFYVIDKSSGKYLVGGSGDRMNLKEAVEAGDIFIERLDAGSDNKYTVKVRFDKDAGNEYQNRSTKFDIKMTISGELTEGGSAQPAPYRPGQVAGGNEAPPAEVLGIEDVKDENGAEEGQSSDNGIVLGTDDIVCKDKLPWWMWVIVLVVFGGFFNGARITKMPKARHVYRIVALVGAILIWFFYDNCHHYWWFLIVVAIIALVSLFLHGQYARTDEEG